MQLDTTDPVIARMHGYIQYWTEAEDRRAIFLTCYALMTQNMIRALAAGEFQNRAWVRRLLERFADTYFDALGAYESKSPDIPKVWQNAFDAAARRDLHVLQHLLLGVNAHINYDLVFVLHELLQSEWHRLDEAAVQSYYADYCYVNTVIVGTINTVQDEVVERYSPLMDGVDKALGGLDELALGHLIRRWREEVWENAAALLSSGPEATPQITRAVCDRGCQRGESITLERGVLGLRHLL